MSFMQPQVWHTSYYTVENKYGETEIVDADLVGGSATIEDMRDYIGGGTCYNGTDNDEFYKDADHPSVVRIRKHLSKAKTARKAKRLRRALENAIEFYGYVREAVVLEPTDGWMAKMSAPGYMDQTEPSSHDTEEEALEALLDEYGNNDGGDPEDWEEGVEERLKELRGETAAA